MQKIETNDNRAETPHVCPVCGQYTFYDWFSYDDCPVCGIEDGYYFGNINDVDKVIAPNWVSVTEGRWIWNKYHCDVNEYAYKHKEKALDKLKME